MGITHIEQYNNKPIYFTDENGSKDMNIDVTYSGTPDKVHDGTDSALWTASAIVGTWDFASTDQNHTAAGAKSIKATDTVDGDIMQLGKGSGIDLNNYTAVTGWIYLTNWTHGSKIEMSGWDTGTSLQVGDTVDFGEYLNVALLNAWQKCVIPLTDFGLASSTIDAFRIKTIKGAQPPNYYLDDLQIEESGVPVEFKIEPRKGTWLHVTSFDITIVDAYDASLVNSNMYNIPYDGFLGVSSLEVGLLAQRECCGQILFQSVFKDLIDFVGLPKTVIRSCGSDGVNTWVKTNQEMSTPLILKAEKNDKFSYIVRDDLSGLKKLWISVGCKEETRDK